MSDFLKEKNLNPINIARVSHEGALFRSYKIRISKFDLDKVLDHSFWPLGIQCRLWKERRHNEYYHPYNIYSDSDIESVEGDDNDNEITNDNSDNNADDSASITNNL